MYIHITLLVFSRSDGLYHNKEENIDGAPMPVLIHTCSASAKNSKTARQQRIDMYNHDENTLVDLNQKYLEGLDSDNPLDLTVRTTQSGSMTKEIFLDSMVHFTKHLAKDQGKNGKFTFLVADSHVSRWNPKALLWLFEHRVIPYFFPSHLSVHVQPQDNNVIYCIHRCINNAEMLPRVVEAYSSIEMLNIMISKALTDFRDSENRTKKKRGSNATTRAWGMKTGLEPAEQMSIGWEHAMNTFGKMNDLKVKNGKGDLYGAFVKKDRPTFTDEDLHLINNAVPNLARNEVSIDKSLLFLSKL